MTKKQTLNEMLLLVNRLRGRIAKDQKTLRELMPQVDLLQKRAVLSELVGVAEGATISYGSTIGRLRGKPCTVLRVNRTRAAVDVNGEQWDFPFELLHVDAVAADLERTLNRSLGALQ